MSNLKSFPTSLNLGPGMSQCIICKQKFTQPTALTLHPGATIEQTRTINFIEILATHLEKRHPKEYELCSLQALQFVTLARLTYFESSDAEINDQRNYLRWSIHQETLNHRYSDDDLLVYCARLSAVLIQDIRAKIILDGTLSDETWSALTKEAGRMVSEVLHEMRKQLQEPDRYNVANDPKLSIS